MSDSFWSQLDKHCRAQARTAGNKVVDKSQQKNARSAGAAGLEVRVTREYDGTGLSGGRDCQWCLDRCGQNMTLAEAYEIGAFERHPGCGCIIDYTTAKGTQRQTDWTHNEWTTIQERGIIKKQKEVLLEKEKREYRLDHTIKPPPAGMTYGSPVRVSVGAQVSGGFEITHPFTGEHISPIPGKRPIYPRDHILAGEGSKTPIRKIDELLGYGGTRSNWRHEKAYIEVYDDDGAEAYVELHWFQSPDVLEKVQQEVRERDGEVFFYDIKEWERKWKW